MVAGIVKHGGNGGVSVVVLDTSKRLIKSWNVGIFSFISSNQMDPRTAGRNMLRYCVHKSLSLYTNTCTPLLPVLKAIMSGFF